LIVNSFVGIACDGEGPGGGARTKPSRGIPAAPAVVSKAPLQDAGATGVAAGPSVPEQACLAAVTNQTNNSDVAVMSNEFSEANSLVMIGVGANRAPWRCLVSNDGIVAEVSSAADEGML